MGIDGYPFLAVGYPFFRIQVHQLRIYYVLPQVHPLPMAAFTIGHPGRHLAGGAGIDADPAVCFFNAFAGGRDAGAGFA